jgi:hypothetical protein
VGEEEGRQVRGTRPTQSRRQKRDAVTCLYDIMVLVSRSFVSCSLPSAPSSSSRVLTYVIPCVLHAFCESWRATVSRAFGAGTSALLALCLPPLYARLLPHSCSVSSFITCIPRASRVAYRPSPLLITSLAARVSLYNIHMTNCA